MIKLYHSKGTRGFRVIWLCEELGIEYEVEKVDFSKEYRTRLVGSCEKFHFLFNLRNFFNHR